MGTDIWAIDDCGETAMWGLATYVVAYIGWASCVLHAWVTWRQSEKLQTAQVGINAWLHKDVQMLCYKAPDAIAHFRTIMWTGVAVLLACTVGLIMIYGMIHGMECPTTCENPFPDPLLLFLDDEATVYMAVHERMERQWTVLILNSVIILLACIGLLMTTNRHALMIVFPLGFIQISYLWYESLGMFGITYKPLLLHYEVLPDYWLKDCAIIGAWLQLISAVAIFAICGTAFTLSEAIQDSKRGMKPAK